MLGIRHCGSSERLCAMWPLVGVRHCGSVCACQVCYARVLDFRRKFIEAAQRYNELSYKSIIAESERMTALKNALICTILASAGTTTDLHYRLGQACYHLPPSTDVS